MAADTELRDADHERLKCLDGHASTCRDHIAQLKVIINEIAVTLQSQMQQLEATMNKSLSALEAEKASRQEVQQLRSTLKAVNTNLQHNVQVTGDTGRALSVIEAEKASRQEVQQLRSTLKAVNTNLQYNLQATRDTGRAFPRSPNAKLGHFPTTTMTGLAQRSSN